MEQGNPFAQIQDVMEFINTMSKTKKQPKEIDGGIRIVILQRGWVAVGRYSRKGTECKLTNAYTFGQWGTSRGLPQLANEGPQSGTQLHKADNDIEFHRGAEVFTIRCTEEKWTKYVS